MERTFTSRYQILLARRSPNTLERIYTSRYYILPARRSPNTLERIYISRYYILLATRRSPNTLQRGSAPSGTIYFYPGGVQIHWRGSTPPGIIYFQPGGVQIHWRGSTSPGIIDFWPGGVPIHHGEDLHLQVLNTFSQELFQYIMERIYTSRYQIILARRSPNTSYTSNTSPGIIYFSQEES